MNREDFIYYGAAFFMSSVSSMFFTLRDANYPYRRACIVAVCSGTLGLMFFLGSIKKPSVNEWTPQGLATCCGIGIFGREAEERIRKKFLKDLPDESKD